MCHRVTVAATLAAAAIVFAPLVLAAFAAFVPFLALVPAFVPALVPAFVQAFVPTAPMAALVVVVLVSVLLVLSVTVRAPLWILRFERRPPHARAMHGRIAPVHADAPWHT
jgi:hypothetical protein